MTKPQRQAIIVVDGCRSAGCVQCSSPIAAVPAWLPQLGWPGLLGRRCAPSCTTGRGTPNTEARLRSGAPFTWSGAVAIAVGFIAIR